MYHKPYYIYLFKNLEPRSCMIKFLHGEWITFKLNTITKKAEFDRTIIDLNETMDPVGIILASQSLTLLSNLYANGIFIRDARISEETRRLFSLNPSFSILELKEFSTIDDELFYIERSICLKEK